MHRREVLRLLATGSLLQLAPSNLFAVLREAHSLIQSQAAPRTLNAHQQVTVKAMAEMIIPRTDTPGASDVGAAEFIDLILTEWYDEAERARFLSGLVGRGFAKPNVVREGFRGLLVYSAGGHPDGTR